MRNNRWGGAIVVATVLTAGKTAGADQPPLHEIHVTARRFAFDPDTIQVIAGEPVRIVVRSTDGAHGFSIRQLNIDVMVPKGGESASIEFAAPAPGRYEIDCSEFCGRGHSGMKAALVSIPSKNAR
jgi:cytochrome c oxidase subunit 2